MSKIREYIESGILEMYVLGMTKPDESKEVESMAEQHREINEEINSIRNDIESYARSHSVEPPLTVKPMLMAMIDYADRMQKGEPASYPPPLTEKSQAKDYEPWLNRADMVPPDDYGAIHAKIIGYQPGATTAIVWLKYGVPPEVHHKEYETFLILEGECDLTIGERTQHLGPGSYLTIPLHVTHYVKVTSEVACKFILQRSAA